MPAADLLPSDLLRTFVTVVDAGGMSAAAGLVGRTQSAVSLQVKRLEDRVGAALFRRDLPALTLTPAGETLLPYARRLIALNEQAIAALAPARLSGTVRLGVVQDFAEMGLAEVLARFAEAHPNVTLDTCVGASDELLDAIAHGALDVTLAIGAGDPARLEPMVWIAADERVAMRDPLPLALLDLPCRYHEAAMSVLVGADIAFRVAYTGPSLSGVIAAVRAGLAVTVRTAALARDGLRIVDAGLPPLPKVTHAVRLHRRAGPAARRLAVVLGDVLAGQQQPTSPATPGAPAPRRARGAP